MLEILTCYHNYHEFKFLLSPLEYFDETSSTCWGPMFLGRSKVKVTVTGGKTLNDIETAAGYLGVVEPQSET